MPTYKQSSSDAKTPIENLTPGRYGFEVIEASEVMAKSGNEMIKLNIKIANHPNRVYDNLVFTERAFWKIDQFLVGTGANLSEGAEVEVTADGVLGSIGIVELGVEPGMGASADREFNNVVKYIHPDAWSAADKDLMGKATEWADDAIVPSAPAAPVADEDMPF
ncbi:MAG: DUF669 domain-containing protein [Myxococcales bacterium]|nr:DUF669 domain-containing protein [Myxococcales bacterium]